MDAKFLRDAPIVFLSVRMSQFVKVKTMIKKPAYLIILGLVLIVAACTKTTDSSLQQTKEPLPATVSASNNAIYFPRQEKKDGEWAAMDALTGGTLVMVDNCIRLNIDKSNGSYLLIWPPDFSVTVQDESTNVLNEENKVVTSVGDRVQMSGGEISSISMLEKYIQDQVPSQCPGPYWIIGYEIKTINP